MAQADGAKRKRSPLVKAVVREELRAFRAFNFHRTRFFPIPQRRETKTTTTPRKAPVCTEITHRSTRRTAAAADSPSRTRARGCSRSGRGRGSARRRSAPHSPARPGLRTALSAGPRCTALRSAGAPGRAPHAETESRGPDRPGGSSCCSPRDGARNGGSCPHPALREQQHRRSGR